MNENLQAILDQIQQSESLSSVEKSILGKSASEASQELLKMRRDLEIEASLEVVRERAMAMQRSDELAELVDTVFKELTKLHFNLDRCIITIINEETRSARYWMANPEIDKTPTSYHVRLDELPYLMATFNAWKERKAKWVYDLKGKEKKATVEYIFSKTELRLLPEAAKKGMKDTNRIFLSSSFSNFGSLQADTLEPLSEENLEILFRFGKVFDLTYTRFNDLKKAEAQAREAQIEVALERVRSRTMAMKKSDELQETSFVLFQQFKELGETAAQMSIGIVNEEEGVVELSATLHGNQLSQTYRVSIDEPFVMSKAYAAWKAGEKSRVLEISGKELYEYNIYRSKLTGIPFNSSENGLETRWIINLAFFSKGMLSFSSDSPQPIETISLLERFAAEFDLTYTRFLDLKKAEAQAREAQIQLAMERVRAKTMAMHRSDELVDAANLMFQQIEELGVRSWNCGFNIWDEDKRHATSWNGTKGGISQPFKSNSSEDVFLHFYDAAQRGETLYVEEIGGDACEAHYRYMATLPLVGDLLKGMAAAGVALPTFQIFHIAYFSQGYLMFITYEPVPELHDIFKRFAKVFEQTYTRFLDLQKAEAQAREAQIEASLERVRGRAMAMYRSDELSDVLSVLFEQFDVLNIRPVDVHLDLFDLEKNTFSYRATGKEGKRVIAEQIVDLDSRPEWQSLAERWKKGKPNTIDFSFYPKEVIRDLMAFFPDIWAAMPEDSIMSPEDFPDGIFDALGYCKFGYIGFHHHRKATEEEQRILIRFANEFERLYQRFLDLHKAEAQAREAQIETALERVRSRTMAMHRSEEIADILARMFEELKRLDMVLVRVLIWIFNPEEKYISWWSANTEVETTAKSYRVDYNEHPVFLSVLDAWQKKLPLKLYTISGAEKDSWQDHLFNNTGLSKLPEMVQKGMRSEGTIFTTSAISDYGLLMSGSMEPLSNENIDILQRFGRVFQQSYTRYIDVQKAEAQARESQIQLAMERVRARTMAMQKSDELAQAANLLFQQMQSLDIPAWSAGYCIWDDDNKQSATFWMSSEGVLQPPFSVPLTENSMFIHYRQAWVQGESFYAEEFGGEELAKHYEYMNAIPDIRKMIEKFDEEGIVPTFPLFQVNHVVYFAQGFLLFVTHQQVPEVHDIFKRFGKVFEQTYTRFLDLQKAEAQAKEAQVQLAMERVRARTMAMQRSDELQDAAQLLFQQVDALGISAFACGYNIWDEDKSAATVWMGSIGGMQPPIKTPSTEDIYLPIYKASLRGESLFVLEQKGAALEAHYKYMASIAEFRNLRENFLQSGFVYPTSQIIHCAFFLQGYLMFITYEAVPVAYDIFKRFAKVFEQTYTRFLDLQKAEAQAKESQIQLALERVRARTMAMQRSEELAEVATVLFQQVIALGVPLWTCGFGIWEIGDTDFTWYPGSHDGGILPPCRIPLKEHPVFISFEESRKRGDELFVYEKEGEFQADHYRYMLSVPGGLGDMMQGILDAGIQFPSFQVDHIATFSHGNLAFITYKHFPEMHDVFKRFAKVFDQTYTRFLDLQKAEAQARESQIELGLERVRARAMAMQKSGELAELVDVFFKELTKLDFSLTWCIINIIDENSLSNTVWAVNGESGKIPESFHMKFEDYPFHHAMMKGWKERKTKYVYTLGGAEKKVYDEYLFNETEFRKVPEAAQKASRAIEKYVCSFSFSNFGGLQTVADAPLSDANLDILSRFGKVFDLTYTRFNDLQKAEAQAKESQIQLAMERVRARTMAMQRSEELADVATILFQQVTALGVPQVACGLNLWEIGEKVFTFYPGSPEGEIFPPCINIPLTEDPIFVFFDESRKRGDELAMYESKDAIQKAHYEYMHKLPGGVGEFMQNLLDAGVTFPTHQVDHIANFSHGQLLFITYEHFPEMHDIFKRFAKVFEQTYTRFLDLQKAEAQAREAQIEAALEKVRSRSLAMHKSDELEGVVSTVFEKLHELNVVFDGGVGILIFTEGSKDTMIWVASPDHFSKASCQNLPYEEANFMNNPILSDMWIEKEKGKDFYVRSYSFEEKNIYFTYLFKHNDYEHMPAEVRSWLLAAESYTHSVAMAKNSAIVVNSWTGKLLSENENEILKRFARVFEQAYIRFLDLQKAEAQAREARIEAGLERVRARTMAMQHSTELIDVATILFQVVKGLGVPQWNCGLNIWEIGDKEFTYYPGNPEGQIGAAPCKISLTEDPVFILFDQSRRRGDELCVQEIGGEIQKAHYNYMRALPGGLGDMLQKMLDAGFHFPEFQIDHIANFSHGNLIFITYEHFPAMHDIFKRFAKVFEQTYTRFLDLQRAESQAMEAVKRASVDRVRAEIASMRTTLDLEKITPLVWNELTTLGVPFIRCGVFIMDEEHQLVHTFLSTPDGKAIAAFRQPYNTPGETSQIIAHWHKKKMYRQHWDEAQFIAFTKNLVDQGAITSGEKYLTENRPTNLDLHFFPFLQGMLYVGNTAPLNDDELRLVQNLADAFSTAYARYEDFNKLESAKVQIENTLVDLKQAQSQLVQSEKMASLGELTAGIAHEIQNPLNFVTNFSEVNKELLAEMKAEMDKGNIKEAKALANDLIQNEDKINHHGRRADAIVKGMLQHSQTTTGQKEPTDINNLADEYFRLSYHGLRAKNKSFHAGMHTEFDKTIGKINIVPQDIGRVLLNLYNNAFYAAAPSLGKGGNGNELTNGNASVWLSTKKLEDKVLISVKDNGPGIPKKVLDKIFQPFFTTKPTGQGTGLGLSLAYDIIKAHGGEIKVETKEGEGAEFIIQLPVV